MGEEEERRRKREGYERETQGPITRKKTGVRDSFIGEGNIIRAEVNS